MAVSPLTFHLLQEAFEEVIKPRGLFQQGIGIPRLLLGSPGLRARLEGLRLGRGLYQGIGNSLVHEE